MAYPENRERNIEYPDRRYTAFCHLWGKYETKLQNLTKSEYGASLQTAENLFSIFLWRGVAPHPTHLLDTNGHVEPELALGFGMMVSQKLVLDRLSSIGKALEQDDMTSLEIPITCDLPILTTRVREMFPPEADGEVVSLCQNGIVDGWNTTLDILGRQDLPLEMFPKNLNRVLRRRTEVLFPSEDGIVLPTALTGVKARYDYSNEFVLPYVSLSIEPSQVA